MGGALYNLFEFLKDYKIDRCASSADVETGDVVVCFDNKTIKCLGKVVHVGRTNLTKDHEDGTYGEIFVLPFYKPRVKKGTPFNRKSLLIFARHTFKRKSLLCMRAEQPGWWMYQEVSVLPKQDEQFCEEEMATNVMYVGHKATTRREQIQENWIIEVEKIVAT